MKKSYLMILQEQLNDATEEKIIVDVSALVNLFPKCQHDQCFKKIKNVKPKFVGSCASIHWECEDSHKDVWYSANPRSFNILNINIQLQRTMELYQHKYIYTQL